MLEHVLVSPARHQIHHSDEVRHYDRNLLAIWDWLGRSLYVPATRDRLRFGLPPDVSNHGNSVLSMLVAPLASTLSRLVPRRHRHLEPTT